MSKPESAKVPEAKPAVQPAAEAKLAPAAAPKAEAVAPLKKMVKVMRVASASPKGGFRRAGFAFSREPTFIPMSELSAAQIKAIKGEPMLSAVETEIAVAE
jgi:hypothetical protein